LGGFGTACCDVGNYITHSISNKHLSNKIRPIAIFVTMVLVIAAARKAKKKFGNQAL
jgi:hypothetical protein